MKNTLLLILIFLIPAALFGQNVVSSTDTIYHDGEKFIRYAEVIYEDGRKVTEYAPMDSTAVAAIYANDIKTLANQVSDLNLKAMDRRMASNVIRKKANEIKKVSGADIVDSVGFPIYDQLKEIEWAISGIDTANVDIELGRNANNFTLRVAGKTFKVFIFNEYWLQIQDFYGKGQDQDLFLYRGSYHSPDFRVSLVAKKRREAPAPKAVVKPQGNTKSASGKVSRRAKAKE